MPPLKTVARRTQLKYGFARTLRAGLTDAERQLWQLLRLKQVAGVRFRRQHPIGPYVVDFSALPQS
jgi:very-short-patch-repair endonuclease